MATEDQGNNQSNQPQGNPNPTLPPPPPPPPPPSRLLKEGQEPPKPQGK